MIRCKCGKMTIKGRCKSCSNRDRKGEYGYNGKNKLAEKNPMWKGDSVGYFALHEFIRNNKPKVELCENCNKNKPFDVANISGEYKRDVNDFKWLCRACHMKEDDRLNKLHKGNEK